MADTNTLYYKNNKEVFVKANFLDFRRNMKDIIKALELNEPVEIYYRGKKKGTIIPEKASKKDRPSVFDDPAFGMWKDRKDMKNPTRWVHDMRRKPRYDI
jgi:hypothetical protein